MVEINAVCGDLVYTIFVGISDSEAAGGAGYSNRIFSIAEILPTHTPLPSMYIDWCIKFYM